MENKSNVLLLGRKHSEGNCQVLCKCDGRDTGRNWSESDHDEEYSGVLRLVTGMNFRTQDDVAEIIDVKYLIEK